MITFDDGYVDNYTSAFPLLRDAGLPACFLVCTGLMGAARMPWQEEWVCCLKNSPRTKRIDSPFGAGDVPYDLDAAHLAESREALRRNVLRLPWSDIPALLERLRALTRVNPSDYVAAPLFYELGRRTGRWPRGGMDIGGHLTTPRCRG